MNASNAPPDADKPLKSGGPERPRSTAAWVLPLFLLAALFMFNTMAPANSGGEIDYSAFYTLVEQDKVSRVTLRGDRLEGVLVEDQRVSDQNASKAFRTRLPLRDDPTLLPLLREHKVEVAVQDDRGSPVWSLVGAVLPWIMIIGAWVWFSRRAQRMSGGNPLAGMLKSRSRRVERQDVVDVTFNDVAGLKSAKRDLQEVVEFLREPERFRRLGGKLPRGLLLMGAPGTGKTLLARAVAGEANVPFFSISGSEFIELFVGVGASRVRELFEQAKKAAPAIIFIDEIDAVGRSRGTGLGGGHDEREQTLNQLLAEMDGFERTQLIVVLAATNRPDVLDPALLRPGRFDRRVTVDLPECDARKAILEVHTQDKPLAADVHLGDVAAATPGFSGADLANLANEAALAALRRQATEIASEDFAAAHDKVVLGDPRETRLTAAEKERVAVHEAGHSVVAHYTPAAEPLRRVSIIPRGMALGATQQVQARDKHLATKGELQARLHVLMGGYAAEFLLLGEVSSGAENDLKQASHIAHKMVAQFGMSTALGPVYHEHRSEHPFLGARIATDGGVSDATVHEIESEARQLLDAALAAARATISENREATARLVSALLEHETLDRPALEQIFEPPLADHAPAEKETSASG